MKKNGFTMIELLATITLLGILSVVAIVSVSGLIKKGKINYYETQESNLIAAAKFYYQSHRNELPKKVGESVTIEYSYLKEKKLIGKLYAYDKKTECDSPSNSTKVTVVKKGNNSYKYSAYLSCK